MQNSIKKQKMTEGPIFVNLILYSLPIILSGVLQLLYNAADLIICGKFGSSHATAAISSTSSLINLVIQIFMGLSVGANVLMARCYGAKDKDKGQRVVYTSMIFSVISGAFLAIFGALMSHTFLVWMGSPDDVIDLSTTYLFIYFLGIPFSMIYNFGSAIFRATGDTKKPFIFLAISGVINVLLNLWFVIGFKLDVAGVALATIISQGASALMIVITMLKGNDFFKFKIKEIRYYSKEGLEIIRIGVPAGIQGAIFSLSNVLIQSSINSLGTNVMDGNGASSSLEGFVYTSMNSVAQACTAFVSANMGAGKKNNIKKTVIYGNILVFTSTLIIGGLVILFHKPLLELYVSNEEALNEGTKRLYIIVLSYFLCGFMDIASYSIRGMGYSISPAIISLTGACLLRIVWIYTIWQLPQLHNLSGLVISYPISWILTGAVDYLVLIIVYRKLNLKECIS